MNKQQVVNSACLQTRALWRAGTAWLFLRYLQISQSFRQKGSVPCSADLKHPSSCSLGSRSIPRCTKASPTLEHWWHFLFFHYSFSHHIPFPPFFCFESPPGLLILSCPPGLEFGSREHMTSLGCGKRNEIGCTIPKSGTLKYYGLSQTQGECRANTETKGEKSHCKQGPTFSPHVL